MVKTIAQGGPRERPRPSRSIAQAGVPMVAPLPDIEAPIAAEPKMDRSVFLYMEPRPAFDGKAYFGQCASCAQFVPEAAMRGAVRGARCALFGSDFPLSDDDSCGFFQPWALGSPCEECVQHNAAELVRGLQASVSPSTAGYISKTAVRCMNCRMFDFGRAGEGISPDEKDPHCEFFEALNEKLPAVFDLDKKVQPGGCCNGFTPHPPPTFDV